MRRVPIPLVHRSARQTTKANAGVYGWYDSRWLEDELLKVVETFARDDRDRQLVNLFRTFLYPRWPYILPPGTPREIVATLRGAMSRSSKTRSFTGNLESSWPTIQRLSPARKYNLPSKNCRATALYKRLVEEGPLPPR